MWKHKGLQTYQRMNCWVQYNTTSKHPDSQMFPTYPLCAALAARLGQSASHKRESAVAWMGRVPTPRPVRVFGGFLKGCLASTQSFHYEPHNCHNFFKKASVASILAHWPSAVRGWCANPRLRAGRVFVGCLSRTTRDDPLHLPNKWICMPSVMLVHVGRI